MSFCSRMILSGATLLGPAAGFGDLFLPVIVDSERNYSDRSQGSMGVLVLSVRANFQALFLGVLFGFCWLHYLASETLLPGFVGNMQTCKRMRQNKRGLCCPL